jgi:transposase
MPPKTTSLEACRTIGIDIGKNTFHLIGLDKMGAIVLRQKLSRNQVDIRLANMPRCLIGMEACVGAHHLSRQLKALGHDARLMPARYVRPYSKGQKNDFRDAEAIAEAVLRPTMKFVAIKTVEQLDLQGLHRVRERLVCQRTSVINQIRAFLLERGIAVRQGLRALRTAMPNVLAMTDKLSPRMIYMFEDLCTDWRHLDARIATVSNEIETLSEQDDGAKRLMTVPGIGPIISTATVAAIGSGDVFSKRLARSRAATDVNRRAHHPRADLQARQSLLADAVRPGSPFRPPAPEELAEVWPQILDRGCSAPAQSVQASDCARQQNSSRRLGRSQWRS